MKNSARLTYDRVRHDQDNDTHLVLSLTAPAMDVQGKRSRICIVPVIDVSPSMMGEKLAYAQRSVLKLIDHLSDGDYCGLVQFSGHAEVLAKPVLVDPQKKNELKRKVGDIRIGSATNIADALLTGLKLANDMDLPPEVVTRVILFTDGSANTGPAISTPDILALVDKNLGLATVSAFGYGRDANQTLLGEMAKRGKANYAFIEHPDAALSAFGRELGGLLSTYAMGITVEVQPLASNRITNVVSDVDADEADASGAVTIKIPDLLMEETRHIVVGVKLPKQKTAFPRAVNVFDAKIMYDVIGPSGGKERKTEDIKVKVQFVKPGEEQEKPDAALDAIVGLAQVVRAQIEAEEKAKKGDYLGAQQSMQQVAVAMNGRGQTPLGNLAASIGDRMSSHVIHAANAGYLRSTLSGGTRGVGVACYDATAEMDLNLAGAVTTTSCTAKLGDTFQRSAGDVVPVSPSVAVDAIHVGPLGGMGGIHPPMGDSWSRRIRVDTVGHVEPLVFPSMPGITIGTPSSWVQQATPHDQGIADFVEALKIAQEKVAAQEKPASKGIKKSTGKVTQKKSGRW